MYRLAAHLLAFLEPLLGAFRRRRFKVRHAERLVGLIDLLVNLIAQALADEKHSFGSFGPVGVLFPQRFKGGAGFSRLAGVLLRGRVVELQHRYPARARWVLEQRLLVTP